MNKNTRKWISVLSAAVFAVTAIPTAGLAPAVSARAERAVVSSQAEEVSSRKKSDALRARSFPIVDEETQKNLEAEAVAKEAEAAAKEAEAKLIAALEEMAAAEEQARQEAEAYAAFVASTYRDKNAPCLTKRAGVFYGPSGKETYYNLNMSKVVSIMRSNGFSETEYPYWVREDGVKMLGTYVMVAAAFSIRPRGSLVECSLGTGLVCDTGTFIYSNPTQLDIAVTW